MGSGEAQVRDLHELPAQVVQELFEIRRPHLEDLERLGLEVGNADVAGKTVFKDPDQEVAEVPPEDEEDDADKEEGSQNATVLARALANLAARQNAAKKAKKKPAKGKK